MIAIRLEKAAAVVVAAHPADAVATEAISLFDALIGVETRGRRLNPVHDKALDVSLQTTRGAGFRPFLLRFMKHWPLALLALFLGNPMSGRSLSGPQEPAAQGCALRIHVVGLRNTKGVVGVLLFRTPDGWPEDVAKSARHEASSIAPGEHEATVVFTGVSADDYGVVALHDENENMKLDKNLFGFPKEGFGFANNPHMGFGPPPFRAAVVHVQCPVTEAGIHIVYK